MTDPAPMSDALADEALLDRLGARTAPEVTEPVAGLLAALGALADEPVGPQATIRTPHRRTFRGRRSIAAAGLLAVALSGAGVAAAMTLPDLGGPTPAPVRTSRSAKPVKPAIPQQLSRAAPTSSKPSTAPSSRGPGGTSGPSITVGPLTAGSQQSAGRPPETESSGEDAAGTSQTGTPLPPSATDNGAVGRGQTGQPGAIPSTSVRGGTPPGPASAPGTPAASVPAQAGYGQQQGAGAWQAKSSGTPTRTASAEGHQTTPPTAPASAAAGTGVSGIPSGAAMGPARKGTSQGSSGRPGSSTR